MAEVKMVQRASFAVIGKEGKGDAEAGADWVPELWEQVTLGLDELAAVLADSQAEDAELWGLMSDAEEWLAPWQGTGRYLAGVTVGPSAEPPAGWEKWQLPAMEFLTIRTDNDHLEQDTEFVFREFFEKNNLELVAAIQEYYSASFEEGEVELYFPIRLL